MRILNCSEQQITKWDLKKLTIIWVAFKLPFIEPARELNYMSHRILFLTASVWWRALYSQRLLNTDPSLCCEAYLCSTFPFFSWQALVSMESDSKLSCNWCNTGVCDSWMNSNLCHFLMKIVDSLSKFTKFSSCASYFFLFIVIW